MRSLFDDTKNPLFRLLCQIVGEIHAGAKYTRKEILERIFSLPEFIYIEAPERMREETIVDAVFNFKDGGIAEIPLDKKVSLPASDTELSWLKSVLTAEENNFLLPAELRKKIMSTLEEIPLLYEQGFWRQERIGAKASTGEDFADKLKVIAEALRHGRKVLWEEELLTPCRLEYDLAADKYFVVVCRADETTIEKIPAEKIGRVKLSEESVAQDIDERLKRFYAEEVAEVSLEVSPGRNAVERCFALLSSFDKKARLQDDGTYFLTVSYSIADEDEVMEKIFSLGSTAKVLAPKNFRERIIKKFTEISKLYE